MNYPLSRPRRNRQSAAIRSMVQENHLRPEHLMAPLFIIEGKDTTEPIPSMPDYFRNTLEKTVEHTKYLYQLGIRSVLLFVKVPEDKKDNAGSEALNPDGLMQRSVKAIKDAVPEMCVMTDVALDPYSSYGHDGFVEDGKIVNDISVQILSEMALSHALAGADFVAPSDMMDGRIGAIREKLEGNALHDTGIMAYSAKYASCFYGPFRDALDSAPGFGDKKTYQMNPANSTEALREVILDEAEGADIVMVKPGMPYLDVVRMVKDSVQIPVSVYQVSGEYAMIKAAAAQGWLSEDDAILESLIGFRRAGADMIATYFAEKAALLL